LFHHRREDRNPPSGHIGGRRSGNSVLGQAKAVLPAASGHLPGVH